ncbi:MAG: hypothetical protein ACTHML_17440 [Ginsengibacter sp.]
MDKRSFIIIAQTIFPAQTPRSYRATELAKELARQGHKVILYAVLGKFDYSEFEKENPNVKVKNIGAMLFSKVNSDNDNILRDNSLIYRAFNKIFGKLFDFPDIELSFKIPKIIHKENDIDCLITIAIPYSIHWGAAFAKSISTKRFPKTWIADCGDPYMGNEFRKPYFYFKFIEKWAFGKMNYITIPIEAAKKGYYKEFHHKIRIIPQGFNFKNVPHHTQSQNSVPTFAYSGILYKDFRDPSLFLQYLTTITTDFKFIIYTKSNKLVLPFIEKLKNKLEVYDYIPREELLSVLSSMDFVINFENPSVIHSPSKLIDYALIKKPILSIKSYEIPKKIFNEFLQGNYTNQFIVNDLERYNISNVAKQFILLTQESANR